MNEPWYDRPLSPADARAALARTRRLLAQLDAEQRRLGAGLAASGLTSFTARSDWLIDRWTPDERIAWRLRWLRLGLADPAPGYRPAWAGFGRPRSRPAIPPDRQLEIALAVLDRQGAA